MSTKTKKNRKRTGKKTRGGEVLLPFAWPIAGGAVFFGILGALGYVHHAYE